MERVEKRLKKKAEGPLTWMLINERQNITLQNIGINIMLANRHHPTSVSSWHRLERFIGRFEKNDIQSLKKNHIFKRYMSIQQLLMEYLSVGEIVDRADFLRRLKDLERKFCYKDIYGIPESLHGYYNIVFRNCKAANVIKGLDSIFIDNNYDKKRENAILKLIYVIAVLENKKINPKIVTEIEDALKKGELSMSEVLQKLDLHKDMIQKYIETIFLPRHYRAMSDFFDLLERINEVR